MSSVNRARRGHLWCNMVERSPSCGAPAGPSRGDFLRGAGAALLTLGLGRPTSAQSTGEKMHTRPIPSSGAALPVIGCGTWQAFDIGDSAKEREPRAEVLRVLFEAGGSVIDSSPMYGRAEGVVGDLLAA